MSKLLLFNPENDTALAFGSANYTPPPAAWQLHQSGDALPMWFGDNGDRFLSQGINSQWLKERLERFSIDITVASNAEISTYKPTPWGWSAHTKRQFLNAGTPAENLPTDEQIAQLRELSHRKSSIYINKAIQGVIPIECKTAEEAIALGPGYIKLPWSSSGRGVINTTTLPEKALNQQLSGMIRRQGSVMWEPAHERVLDFAMLFENGSESTQWIGFSAFQTTDTGAYCGNIVASQEYIEAHIKQYYDTDILKDTARKLCPILRQLIGTTYIGAFGVDMMIFKDLNGKNVLAPCIELNLRMTMGVVALKFAEKHLADGKIATLEVVKTSDLDQRDEYTTANGKLTGGTLHLSPPKQFTIKVTVKN